MALGLQVAFTPAGISHAAHYKQAILIKITHNNKGPLITCTASSLMLKAAFDPPLLDLGAILPCFDGQQPNQALLKLSNPFSVDMEVLLVNCPVCAGQFSIIMTRTLIAQVLPKSWSFSLYTLISYSYMFLYLILIYSYI